MTVKALSDALSAQVFHISAPDREVTGGYAGDLLSWVMGRAQAGHAWITIMSNSNVAAVSLMSDVSCVILSEGVRPDPDLLRRAQENDVNLIGLDADTYSIAVRIGALLG